MLYFDIGCDVRKAPTEQACSIQSCRVPSPHLKPKVAQQRLTRLKVSCASKRNELNLHFHCPPINFANNAASEDQVPLDEIHLTIVFDLEGRSSEPCNNLEEIHTLELINQLTFAKNSRCSPTILLKGLLQANKQQTAITTMQAPRKVLEIQDSLGVGTMTNTAFMSPLKPSRSQKY
jgi:hypothetical protein